MAPCCWAGNLVDHRSEIALQMKKEIALWVAQGKTDREILDTYKQRYGARILAEPEGPARVWLNAVPALVILTGFVLVLLLLRRWRRVRPSHA
jgi:cytochrome c-type biogenesis protein CcmH